MDSNILNMMLVLGGTLLVSVALLYFSLKTHTPGETRRAARSEVAATTAAMIAANQGDTDDLR
jgi:hypothetical protein